MDLKGELIQLLEKAMNSKEYFNPKMIDGVIEGIIDVYGDEAISPEIDKWASNMWSR
jgi:hypothetical protein